MGVDSEVIVYAKVQKQIKKTEISLSDSILSFFFWKILQALAIIFLQQKHTFLRGYSSISLGVSELYINYRTGVHNVQWWNLKKNNNMVRALMIKGWEILSIPRGVADPDPEKTLERNIYQINSKFIRKSYSNCQRLFFKWNKNFKK